jgi:Tol biopolymer transport system component
VKRLGQTEITRLTNDAAIECYPAWSPNGKWIAFLHCGPGGIEGYIASTASVYVIPADGGEKRKVGEVRSPTSLYLAQLAWTPDSRWLVVRNRESASDRHALFLLSLATGEQKQITFPPPGSDNDVAPAISPDGRFLAFARTSSWEVRQVYVVPLSRDYSPTAQPRKLTSGADDILAVFWGENVRELLYYSRGPASLWRVDPLRGEAPRRVPALGPWRPR